MKSLSWALQSQMSPHKLLRGLHNENSSRKWALKVMTATGILVQSNSEDRQRPDLYMIWMSERNHKYCCVNSAPKTDVWQGVMEWHLFIDTMYSFSSIQNQASSLRPRREAKISHPHPAIGFACIVTFSILTTSPFILPFLSTSLSSILAKDRIPSSPITCPNTVFFPSRCGAGAYSMKNWLPFVPGPLFAIETIPRALCRKEGRISSSKSEPHIDVETFGVADAGLPVWTMKLGMERWKGESSYANEAQRARKFCRNVNIAGEEGLGEAYLCRLRYRLAEDFYFEVTASGV